MCTATIFGLILVTGDIGIGSCAVQRKALLLVESDCKRLRSEDVLLSDPSEDGEDGNRTEDVRPAVWDTVFFGRLACCCVLRLSLLLLAAGL